MTLGMTEARSRNDRVMEAAGELKAGKIGRAVFCLPKMLRENKWTQEENKQISEHFLLPCEDSPGGDPPVL